MFRLFSRCPELRFALATSPINVLFASESFDDFRIVEIAVSLMLHPLALLAPRLQVAENVAQRLNLERFVASKT